MARNNIKQAFKTMTMDGKDAAMDDSDDCSSGNPTTCSSSSSLSLIDEDDDPSSVISQEVTPRDLVHFIRPFVLQHYYYQDERNPLSNGTSRSSENLQQFDRICRRTVAAQAEKKKQHLEEITSKEVERDAYFASRAIDADDHHMSHHYDQDEKEEESDIDTTFDNFYHTTLISKFLRDGRVLYRCFCECFPVVAAAVPPVAPPLSPTEPPTQSRPRVNVNQMQYTNSRSVPSVSKRTTSLHNNSNTAEAEHHGDFVVDGDLTDEGRPQSHNNSDVSAAMAAVTDLLTRQNIIHEHNSSRKSSNVRGVGVGVSVGVGVKEEGNRLNHHRRRLNRHDISETHTNLTSTCTTTTTSDNDKNEKEENKSSWKWWQLLFSAADSLGLPLKKYILAPLLLSDDIMLHPCQASINVNVIEDGDRLESNDDLLAMYDLLAECTLVVLFFTARLLRGAAAAANAKKNSADDAVAEQREEETRMRGRPTTTTTTTTATDNPNPLDYTLALSPRILLTGRAAVATSPSFSASSSSFSSTSCSPNPSILPVLNGLRELLQSPTMLWATLRGNYFGPPFKGGEAASPGDFYTNVVVRTLLHHIPESVVFATPDSSYMQAPSAPAVVANHKKESYDGVECCDHVGDISDDGQQQHQIVPDDIRRMYVRVMLCGGQGSSTFTSEDASSPGVGRGYDAVQRGVVGRRTIPTTPSPRPSSAPISNDDDDHTNDSRSVEAVVPAAFSSSFVAGSLSSSSSSSVSLTTTTTAITTISVEDEQQREEKKERERVFEIDKHMSKKKKWIQFSEDAPSPRPSVPISDGDDGEQVSSSSSSALVISRPDDEEKEEEDAAAAEEEMMLLLNVDSDSVTGNNDDYNDDDHSDGGGTAAVSRRSSRRMKKHDEQSTLVPSSPMTTTTTTDVEDVPDATHVEKTVPDTMDPINDTTSISSTPSLLRSRLPTLAGHASLVSSCLDDCGRILSFLINSDDDGGGGDGGGGGRCNNDDGNSNSDDDVDVDVEDGDNGYKNEQKKKRTVTRLRAKIKLLGDVVDAALSGHGVPLSRSRSRSRSSVHHGSSRHNSSENNNFSDDAEGEATEVGGVDDDARGDHHHGSSLLQDQTVVVERRLQAELDLQAEGSNSAIFAVAIPPPPLVAAAATDDMHRNKSSGEGRNNNNDIKNDNNNKEKAHKHTIISSSSSNSSSAQLDNRRQMMASPNRHHDNSSTSTSSSTQLDSQQQMLSAHCHHDNSSSSMSSTGSISSSRGQQEAMDIVSVVYGPGPMVVGDRDDIVSGGNNTTGTITAASAASKAKNMTHAGHDVLSNGNTGPGNTFTADPSADGTMKQMTPISAAAAAMQIASSTPIRSTTTQKNHFYGSSSRPDHVDHQNPRTTAVRRMATTRTTGGGESPSASSSSASVLDDISRIIAPLRPGPAVWDSSIVVVVGEEDVGVGLTPPTQPRRHLESNKNKKQQQRHHNEHEEYYPHSYHRLTSPSPLSSSDPIKPIKAAAKTEAVNRQSTDKSADISTDVLKCTQQELPRRAAVGTPADVNFTGTSRRKSSSSSSTKERTNSHSHTKYSPDNNSIIDTSTFQEQSKKTVGTTKTEMTKIVSTFAGISPAININPSISPPLRPPQTRLAHEYYTSEVETHRRAFF